MFGEIINTPSFESLWMAKTHYKHIFLAFQLWLYHIKMCGDGTALERPWKEHPIYKQPYTLKTKFNPIYEAEGLLAKNWGWFIG